MNFKIIIAIIVILLIAVGIGYCLFKNNPADNTNVGQNSNIDDNITVSNENTDKNNKRILIAYYSRTGNTEEMAKYIQEKVGGDLFKIETVKEYPSEYTQTTEVAQQEKSENARPELKQIVNVDDYDIVFIGSPIWWGTCPMAVFTYAESQNFEGKTVIQFVTHGGSGMSSAQTDFRKVSNASKYLDGLAISGSSVSSSKDTIDEWINGLDI